MRNRLVASALLLPLLLLGGCDLAQGILKIGFWTGVIVVLLVVGVLWFVMRAFRR